ncbi:branched-chain amino acid ABC transporter substrate-binding protein [Camelimonas fluminis]|uniref:ABC transporter substrate-binding protein n=1 Tax=Camelimonas fluminis TaxID=1576911 RepID=A0ABV7UGT4_9HYPH|nr:ABC transporter substrate-binding protein [Camelimonas fluminis]GHE78407.1 branched-chain amino acid ABC transporter substrate-binding protein [Camelimonas fluminis]
MRALMIGALGVAAMIASSQAGASDKKYDGGASDTEIRIGQTIPHSGPGAPYGVIGRSLTAYFDMLNETKGGVNGRKVRFISLDDAYSTPKTVEQTRKLVEQDDVLAIYGSTSSAGQLAIQKYMNSKGVPQAFVMTGASRWNNPKEFPWTIPGQALYPSEGKAMAQYALRKVADPKIALFYQNDEFGRDYVKGFKEALGDRAGKLIVAEASYDLTDPTVDSQILKLSQSGANILMNASAGKASSQAIRKMAELGWKPLHLVSSTAVGAPLINAAGPENAKGLTTARTFRSLGSPEWANDPDILKYQEFRKKYLPNVDADNDLAFIAYSAATVLERILERCGDDLTRKNVLKQMTSIKGMTAPGLLPGVTYAITPDDYTPFSKLYISVFDGKNWNQEEVN